MEERQRQGPDAGLDRDQAAGQPASAPSRWPTGNSSIIWVGHNNGDVFKTTNGTVASPTWTAMDNGATPLPNRYCTRVTISPSNPNQVYATFGGYNSGNIWKSTNGGTNWTNVSASLPDAPVYDVDEHPGNPNFLYAATEVGVFASSNGGTTWFPTNLGPANVAVFELTWMKRLLVAVTHGRGLFWIDLTTAAPWTCPCRPRRAGRCRPRWAARPCGTRSRSDAVDRRTAGQPAQLPVVGEPDEPRRSGIIRPLGRASTSSGHRDNPWARPHACGRALLFPGRHSGRRLESRPLRGPASGLQL